MKLSKFFLGVFAVLLCAAGLQAQNNNEAQYTNGFSLGVSGVGVNQAPTIQGGYYFAKNNCMSFQFSVSPYTQTNNLFAVRNNDSWSTQIGATLSNYIPLARSMLKNMFFLDHGIAWAQTFGKTPLGALTISSEWFVGYKIGMQYRLNPKVYFGVVSPVGYSQTIFKDVLASSPTLTNKQTSVVVFNTAVLYMTYKF